MLKYHLRLIPIVLSVVAILAPLSAVAGDRWAVLIGVNTYSRGSGLTNLNYCRNDAEALRDRLVEAGFPKKNIRLLASGLGEEDLPSGRNIKKAIEDQLQLTERGDMVLISFSGHGVSHNGTAYLCPSDTDQDKPDESMIGVRWLYGQMESARASRRLLLADACRNNPFRSGDKARSEKSLQGVAKSLSEPPKGVIVLAGCRENQRCWELHDKKHGAFMYHVLQGLSGSADTDASRGGNRDGRVSWMELIRYATYHTKVDVYEEYRHVQTPEFFGSGEDFPLVETGRRLDFTVREEDAAGPTLAGAALALVYRPSSTSADEVLHRGRTDAQGRLTFALPTEETTRQGEYLAIVLHDGRSRRWKLSRFPEPGQWNLYSYVPPPKDFTNSIGMKLKLIPAGEFMMGSPGDEESRSGDETQHRVRITKPYYLGVYEVTQAEYEKVIGENPSSSKGPTRPVTDVRWEDAAEFCRKLSAKDGRTYRLPTEAEWEYACRAGTTTPFHFGRVLNGTQANCSGDYPYGTETKGPDLGGTTTVGSYAANGWGLYDMHGNVYEWCAHWYDEDYYARSPTENPDGASTGSLRVGRGGSWFCGARNCRSACRDFYSPGNRSNGIGFRVAQVPSE